MPVLGISRVTDITRLDRLGLPVFSSVRPRGGILHVHAGKGVGMEDARIGALMEAVEYAVAERASDAGPDAHLSLQALLAQLPGGLQLADFSPQLGVAAEAGRAMAAARCLDLATGKRVFLPAELVFVPWQSDSGLPLFGHSSNGLASGNSLEEATLHALLEVLERDAIAMNRARDASSLLDNTALPAPFNDWAEAWRRLGVELIVRFVPNELGLPCFEAHLHEAVSSDVNFSGGSGLHLDREMALARAICEAAQTRLTNIHGARDEISFFFGKYKGADPSVQEQAEARLVAALADPARCIDFHVIPQVTCRSIRTALKEVMSRMAVRGFVHVFRRRFGLKDCGVELQGLHVVKVVVPKCEALPQAGMRMGPRLMRRVFGHD